MRLLLVPLLLMLALPAVGQQLYRWKDDQGVTHYTDQPPTGRPFETREIAAEPASRDAADADAGDADAVDADADADAYADAEDGATARAATPPGPTPLCLQARANLRVFETSADVSMDLDGDGVPEKLDAAAHARELARTRDLVREHCTD